MISSLGYLGIGVSDLAAWTSFATGMLGLMPAAPVEGESRFRNDQQAWRIALLPGGADDIIFAGFEVAGPAELEALRARLSAAGVTCATDPKLAAHRGVLDLFSCNDPDGLRIEIYYGASERGEEPFRSPAGVSAFVTGDQGMGHIVLATRDIAAARRFYQELLGFRLSDIIRMRPAPGVSFELEFFHCNPRHHTLALAPVPAPKRLHHFMLQAATFDDVGFALERLEETKTPLATTLGRHTNDHMVSFYCRSPSGFEVEFGHGARVVDDAVWRVARHDSGTIWGHHRVGGKH